ncbi:MAG: bifunctional precorrin-2 dehydrogenase/sirohydrochlorin ferrochelatase [Nitriliruptorales bacterium]|nr:bifunctional precorrin-2 dehydrogenase/sirohydrochlorin ferrochelatase [Nitriliruptorales bacterium]
MAFEYAVNLDLSGRPVVVFGGGALASDRVSRLLEVGADVRIVTPKLGEALVGLDVRHEPRIGRVEDLDGAFLAIATGEDQAPVSELFAEAEHRGVLFATIDDVEHSHFGAASTIRRGDLQLTISTAGKAPALSKRLRRELEEQIDDAHGELVEILHRARQRLLPRTVPFGVWARAWEEALADLDGLLALVREGAQDAAEERVVTSIRQAL